MYSHSLSWSLGLVTSGAMIGFLVGLTGVGAGSVTTSLLISAFGVPPSAAVGTDLLFAALTKSTAAWRFQKFASIDWTVLRWLSAGSLPATLATLAWLQWAHPDTVALAQFIRKALAIILIFSAFANFAFPWLVRRNTRSDAAIQISGRQKALTLCLGLLIGVMVVLTSVGAGAIGMVVLLLLFPTMPLKRLIGTDIVHAIPLTLVAGLGHLSLGTIDGRVLGLLLLGSIPGIALGVRVTGSAPDWIVRNGLAVVLLLAAVLLLMK